MKEQGDLFSSSVPVSVERSHKDKDADENVDADHVSLFTQSEDIDIDFDTRFSLDCENTNLFVERLEKDKDTDKDVDADRDGTVRPVGGHWSLQFEEIDIDFRVSGLPHVVVKQAENFRVRELVKRIESHPHRRALQADLQQNNAYNPFSDE